MRARREKKRRKKREEDTKKPQKKTELELGLGEEGGAGISAS